MDFAGYAYAAAQTTRLAGDREIDAAQERLEALARVLDSAIGIPGTQVRIGADLLLNLIPGIGFVVSKGIAGYLVWEARRLGAPKRLLLRMLGNLGVDAAFSAVPVLGWAADAVWRSNERNMEILRMHLARERAARRGPVIDAAT
ncbi:MAG: DUF4112 domain-containing protein [Rhodospirillales bacterium]|jgi:hypothetical protein